MKERGAQLVLIEYVTFFIYSLNRQTTNESSERPWDLLWPVCLRYTTLRPRMDVCTYSFERIISWLGTFGSRRIQSKVYKPISPFFSFETGAAREKVPTNKVHAKRICTQIAILFSSKVINRLLSESDSLTVAARM